MISVALAQYLFFSKQIKADVETQGEFVNSLIREVNSLAYQNIEDVVAFVKWLDDELSFLVSPTSIKESSNIRIKNHFLKPQDSSIYSCSYELKFN